MASKPKPAETARDPLEATANERLRQARRWKELWVLDFKECYFFTAPHRQRQISSQTAPPSAPLLDAAELQTSLAFELAQDFVTEVVNTYMPEAQQWCERGRGMFVPEDAWDQIKDQVAKDDKVIFEAMKASNLYDEIQKAFYPDLAIGTCAMWIQRPLIHQAITVSAIPLRELEVNLGPFGEIDDRFAVRYTRNCYVRALLPGIPLPPEVADIVDKKPDERTQVIWGYWRIWDRHDDEVWQHVVLVNDKLVHKADLVGEGSCPMAVPRFNPSADWPWGLGPMIQGLPDFRQVDELEGQKVAHIEMQLTPPITYPDDSFSNVEQGLESGMAYPVRPGSANDVKRIYDPGPADAGIYLHEEMEKRLRRLFFVDYPQQTGDTPPTLGQWLDQMARAQRRIGGPGKPFYREGPLKIFLRFKFLLEAAGAIKPVTVNGKSVALMPYNPAQRAAEQQEIATAAQAAQMLASMFPEEWKMVIDGRKTMVAFIEKMRVTGLLQLRDEEQVKAFVAQATQLIGGQKAGAQPAAGAAPAAAA